MLSALPAMTRTLLIVDDNESVRESLRFLLEHRGYVTTVVASGAEAIAATQQQVFDGAMIDMNMPGMNGLAVCRALHARAAETGHKLSIWMMTGAPTSELLKAAHEAGALALFSKPFEFDEVFRRMDERLRAAPPPSPPSPPPAD